jgi:hypothetical protein
LGKVCYIWDEITIVTPNDANGEENPRRNVQDMILLKENNKRKNSKFIL